MVWGGGRRGVGGGQLLKEEGEGRGTRWLVVYCVSIICLFGCNAVKG